MLYIVSTPIGNREDITLRALKTLRSVDMVFAEDTRSARNLLGMYRIKKPLDSYADHNQKIKTPRIIQLLAEGKRIALISEAGTPLVSDPGFGLVQECIRRNLSFDVIPGVSSVTAALVLGGLSTDRFLFIGFLPRKKGKRKTLLENIRDIEATLIFFESPFRIPQILADAAAFFPQRQIVLVRELTKKFQEVLRFASGVQAAAAAGDICLKGEFTVLIQGNTRTRQKREVPGD